MKPSGLGDFFVGRFKITDSAFKKYTSLQIFCFSLSLVLGNFFIGIFPVHLKFQIGTRLFIISPYYLFLSFKVYLFILREQENESDGGAERERIPSRLSTISSGPNSQMVRSYLREMKSQTLS